MEQLTRCNHCGYEYLVWIEEHDEDSLEGFTEGSEFICPACGSEDTTCI